MILLQSRKTQSVLIQAAYLGGLLSILVAGAITARRNLDAQGIKSSFDFLWKATGWNLTFSLLPATTSDPYWWFLLMGFVNTIVLGLTGLAAATLLGGLVGMARVSANKAARLLGTVYVEMFRNIPMIVQVFFWYGLASHLPGPRQSLEFGGLHLNNRGLYFPGFNVPVWSVMLFYAVVALMLVLIIWVATARRFGNLVQGQRRRLIATVCAFGVACAIAVIYTGHAPGTDLTTAPELRGLNISGGYRLRPEFLAMAFSIATYGAAYIGEIVRGGFNAVPQGQTEAARSLGLTSWQTFVRIRLPIALRSMLPILANQYVWLVKATTLGIAVGFADFFMIVLSSITQSGQTLEFIGILMGGFLLLNLSIAAIFNTINRRIALKGHGVGR